MIDSPSGFRTSDLGTPFGLMLGCADRLPILHRPGGRHTACAYACEPICMCITTGSDHIHYVHMCLYKRRQRLAPPARTSTLVEASPIYTSEAGRHTKGQMHACMGRACAPRRRYMIVRLCACVCIRTYRYVYMYTVCM